MMKKLIPFLLCLLLLSFSVQAQNTLKTGLSYAKFGADGQQGVSYYTEYNHQLSPILSLAPSIQMAYGTKGQDFPYYLLNKFAAGLDFNLYYTPIHLGKAMVRFGIGPSLRYFSGRNSSLFYISNRDPNNYDGWGSLGPDGSYYVPYFFPYDRFKTSYIGIGYSGIIETELNLSTHWIGGLRAAYQGYSSRDNIITVGFNVGYRF